MCQQVALVSIKIKGSSSKHFPMEWAWLNYDLLKSTLQGCAIKDLGRYENWISHTGT